MLTNQCMYTIKVIVMRFYFIPSQWSLTRFHSSICEHTLPELYDDMVYLNNVGWAYSFYMCTFEIKCVRN